MRVLAIITPAFASGFCFAISFASVVDGHYSVAALNFALAFLNGCLCLNSVLRAR